MEPVGPYTVTVERVTRDRHGDPTGPASTHEISGCDVQQLDTETQDGPETTIASGLWLFAPYGSDVEREDRIVFRGTSYRVQGQPFAWDGLDGEPSHVEARLRYEEVGNWPR